MSPLETSFSVNRRIYNVKGRPIVVVCLDGSSDEYLNAALARGRMPHLQRMAVEGHRGVARAALPSFTNVNNASIITGVPPSVHGISGNFFYDSSSGEEVMMNSARYLRAESILTAAANAGRKVAVITAKDKLRDIFAHQLKGIAFSSEKAGQAQLSTHGIEGAEAVVGRPTPDIYSPEASLYVLWAGVALLEKGLADFLYLSTTDYMQHTYAPDAPQAVEFYAAIDQELGKLMKLGAILGLTADHGMNAKQKLGGEPNVLYLESLLEKNFGAGFRVILPITDPYVVHHGALGSFAVVHLPSLQFEVPIIEWLSEQPGITEVYDRRTAARKLELPQDRLGELVVLAGRDLVLGRTPRDHDLKALHGGLRSHGGRYEEMVPFLCSERLTPPYAAKAACDPRNFDIFDFTLNGTVAPGIDIEAGRVHMIDAACYIAGQKVPSTSEDRLEVRSPYDGRAVGAVGLARREHAEAAIEAALAPSEPLTRYQRSAVLDRARGLLEQRHEEFARLITAESGLCIRETRYEVRRAIDVLRFASIEALRDDGQIFSCDISANGKPRKIFTVREPLSLILAITPFNHPLNQVAHKIAPAIAAGTPAILKPSEKTPLTAVRFAELLYEAGLPGRMLSVLLGPTHEIATPLVSDPRIELVSFTGSVAVGKRIAQTAGYKKIILELGGNDPLIVLEDADLELAVLLAAEGSFRNSGQRCTAVKRILVHETLAETFAARLTDKTAEYRCGDPMDEATRVGTVIDEASAIHLEEVVAKAVAAGAKVLQGGRRTGALLEPTVIAGVPRDAEMIVCESFGPLAPIVTVRDLDDAIEVANSTVYGLSSGVVTRSMDHALHAIKALKCGTVNINEVPGFRIENSPFGGIRDSGLGIKEGVIEAVKCMSFVKTFSLPW